MAWHPCRYTAAVNAAYAATFGHTFVLAGPLEGDRPSPSNMDVRFAKVLLLGHVLDSGEFDVALWLDADAVLLVRGTPIFSFPIDKD